MNGAHRESHHPACPLLLRRRTPRRPRLLHTAHPLQTACFPKPRLFIFTLFSRCLFSLLRSGLPFFLRSLFLSRASPRSTLSARESGVLFPARSKTPLRSLLRPGCSFSFLLNPGLSVVISFPFSFLPLPARSSAFRLNAILSVVTFPLHVTFPCSRFRLSPQSRPSVVTSLFPLAFPACAFLFPNPVFTAGKRQQKKPFPYGKGFLPSAFPNPTNKKTFSERTLKRFPFKMDQTNSMMTRRAASPLRGSSFMIRV